MKADTPVAYARVPFGRSGPEQQEEEITTSCGECSSGGWGEEEQQQQQQREEERKAAAASTDDESKCGAVEEIQLARGAEAPTEPIGVFNANDFYPRSTASS